MKKYYLLSLIVAMTLFSGCQTTDENTSQESEYQSDTSDSNHDSYDNSDSDTSQESEYQSDSNNDDDNDDNDDENDDNIGSTNISYHNQGSNCLSCHGLNSGGEDPFTSGGTIFTKIDAQSNDGTSYANAYRLRLLLENTNQTITYSSGRGTANSNSEFNAGGVNNYTAQVIDEQGNMVNQSLANSHNLARLDCNSCHTASGTSGAPGRIVSYDYYASLSTQTPTPTPTPVPEPTPTPIPEPVTTPVTTPVTSSLSFATDVMPILTTSCQACHGTARVFQVSTASATYTNIQSFSGFNTLNPTSSYLLQKGSGQVGHGGGTILGTTSAGYITIRDWIAAGAVNN